MMDLTDDESQNWIDPKRPTIDIDAKRDQDSDDGGDD